MTSPPASHRLAFAFACAFPPLYVMALFRDLALFTVYPSLGVVLWGTHRSRDVVDPALGFLAPEMFWYGWTATAAFAALPVAAIIALAPGQWTRRIWPIALWAVPILGMMGCIYFELPWLRR